MAASGDSCQRKCGKIEIPYPFGMNKEDCHLDEAFEVKCKESTGSASLAGLGNDELEIEFISTSTHSLRIKKFPASDVKFNKSGVASFSFDSGVRFEGHSLSFLRRGSPYHTSYTKNKIVVMGCDFYAYLIDLDRKEFLGGCAPFCNRTDVVSSSSSPCSGLGCCEINRPKRWRRVELWFETMNTETRSWEYQCGLFTIMDKDFLRLHNIQLPQCNKDYYFPLTYEWAVGNTSCNKAKGRDNYVCGQNTDCFNSDAGMGYRCQCRKGYKGNPYLPHGCQDVDECAKATYNHCPRENLCVNTEEFWYQFVAQNRNGPCCLSSNFNWYWLMGLEKA